jgi:hypothetical protein
MKRRHKFADNDGYADTLTSRRSNFVGEADLPADYGRIVGGITAEFCHPSKTEFEQLDKAPVWWKTSAEWTGLANKYEDASRMSTENLLEYRNQLKAKAAKVDLFVTSLNQMAVYPAKLFTAAQWTRFATILDRLGMPFPAKMLAGKAVDKTVATTEIITNIDPPDVWEAEYQYLQSFPDGVKTKAELLAASKRFADAGYAKYAGGLNAKAMYFDIVQDAPKPSWWTDVNANPDYKTSSINVPFAYPKADVAITYAEPKILTFADGPPEEPFPEAIYQPSLNTLLELAKKKAASRTKRKWWKVMLRIKEPTT